jgi:hypothetical protein
MSERPDKEVKDKSALPRKTRSRRSASSSAALISASGSESKAKSPRLEKMASETPVEEQLPAADSAKSAQRERRKVRRINEVERDVFYLVSFCFRTVVLLLLVLLFSFVILFSLAFKSITFHRIHLQSKSGPMPAPCPDVPHPTIDGPRSEAVREAEEVTKKKKLRTNRGSDAKSHNNNNSNSNFGGGVELESTKTRVTAPIVSANGGDASNNSSSSSRGVSAHASNNSSGDRVSKSRSRRHSSAFESKVAPNRCGKEATTIERSSKSVVAVSMVSNQFPEIGEVKQCEPNVNLTDEIESRTVSASSSTTTTVVKNNNSVFQGTLELGYSDRESLIRFIIIIVIIILLLLLLFFMMQLLSSVNPA